MKLKTTFLWPFAPNMLSCHLRWIPFLGGSDVWGTGMERALAFDTDERALSPNPMGLRRGWNFS